MTRRDIAALFGFVASLFCLLTMSGLYACSSCAPAPTRDMAEFHANAKKHHKHKPIMNKHHRRHGRSHAHIRVDDTGATMRSVAPRGLVPNDLVNAYSIPAGGQGVVFAIIDAFDNPNAEADLAVYRNRFGLPPCTTANGCFRKVNQSGEVKPLPGVDINWAGEISLDLDMASATCPACKIILVEVSSAAMFDFGDGINTAVRLGATVISNSYGGAEDQTDLMADASFFHHPGVTITASSGDSGFGAQYPSSSSYVISVGGTTLIPASNTRGWAESTWAGTGSGCSAYALKPGWQKDSCDKRMAVDVAAVADPDTGVAVYDSFDDPSAGWVVMGGTSASAPIVAGIIAAAGKAGIDASWFYAHTNTLLDVVSGSNGQCVPSYYCHAGEGFDGPTGLGVPNGAAIKSGEAAPIPAPTPPPGGCAKTP